jgi:hypothetical protein
VSATRYEQRIRRRGELSAHLSKDEWDRATLDKLMEHARRQELAKMAAREIHWRVLRARHSVGDISGR